MSRYSRQLASGVLGRAGWSFVALLALRSSFNAADEGPSARALGREVSMTKHLQDDEEFRTSMPALIAHGKLLFSANWTDQEGAGRPLSKGTGKKLADPSRPLVGLRSFNRISGPDANACAGCHNAPYGIAGGAGDIVGNVFVLAQRIDFTTFDRKDLVPTGGSIGEDNQPVTLERIGNSRATTHLFGAGYLEMLARQMTGELQALRDTVRNGEAKILTASGVGFGRIKRSQDGLWDVSEVEGLPWPSLVSHGSNDPPSLIIRPWHQAGNVVSIREFTNNALVQHHGIQSTERFGVGTDADGDGVRNEITRADVTAMVLYQATLQVPGRVIPNDPIVEKAVKRGERTFASIGCANCHIPTLPLDQEGAIFTEPNPYNPPGNLRSGETRTIRVDLDDTGIPSPRLTVDRRRRVVDVPAYTDFKLHDITGGEDEREPLDMNRATWSPKFREGNRRFLTKRLWGVASAPNHYHHGLFTTMRRAIEAHAGEAIGARRAYGALPIVEQDALIEFLKTLQVLPPGTKDLLVDEHFRPKQWHAE